MTIEIMRAVVTLRLRGVQFGEPVKDAALPTDPARRATHTLYSGQVGIAAASKRNVGVPYTNSLLFAVCFFSRPLPPSALSS